MKTRSHNSRSMIETLETRSLMSIVVTADFNNDTRPDKAEVTSDTTITVSLQQSDGSYRATATLTAPKNLPVNGFNVSDVNGDGKLDITAGGVTSNHFYSHTWLGNGDGTFGARHTERSSNLKWWV